VTGENARPNRLEHERFVERGHSLPQVTFQYIMPMSRVTVSQMLADKQSAEIQGDLELAIPPGADLGGVRSWTGRDNVRFCNGPC